MVLLFDLLEVNLRGSSGSTDKPTSKQGLVQDYSQRLIEGNIYKQKLSRLKLYRLRLHRHKPGWAKGHGLRLYSLSLYGSETGGGGGSNEIIYSSISRKNSIFLSFRSFFEKSLDLANFVNFADLPQGG